jgi:hypothetical protein
MYNTSRTVLFLETYDEDTLIHPYKEYSSLNRCHTNRDLLSTFILYNLFSVTIHLRQGKKVSILLPGDVNPGPVLSRRGLLENSPYRAVGAAVHRAMSYDRTPRACGDLGMSCGDFRKT